MVAIPVRMGSMAVDTDSYIDAKAAEIHAKARAAFRLGMWMISVVIAATAAGVGTILAVLG